MSQPQPMFQLIDASSEVQTAAFQDFLDTTGVADAGRDYLLIAIMGPQSSGKSTLMNHVFGTRFTMMDALAGRGQTTRGIWMGLTDRLDSPAKTMVLDLEGTDGRERGEDDLSFERQSALFALAASDILLVNIWCHDVGREQGSGKPLMKTIFQVNLKLFAQPNKDRKVLLFVVRDRSKTPFSKLCEVLQEDLDTIWESLTKPPGFEGTSVRDVFEVEFLSLPNYEEKEEEFIQEATDMRQRFIPGVSGSLVRPMEDKVPATAFAMHLSKMWEVIRAQKDLDLPAHKVMVANCRCEEIMRDVLGRLMEDQAFVALQDEAAARIVPDFGARASGLADSCISGYDNDAQYFESSIVEAKRVQLLQDLMVVLAPSLTQQVASLKEAATTSFLSQLAARGVQTDDSFTTNADICKREALTAFQTGLHGLRLSFTDHNMDADVDALGAELDTTINDMRVMKLKTLLGDAEEGLKASLDYPATDLLRTVPSDVLPQLTALFASSTDAACRGVTEGLDGYGVAPEDMAAAQASIAAAATSIVQARVSEAARAPGDRMLARFRSKFDVDADGVERRWRRSDRIPEIASEARLAAAEALASLVSLPLTFPLAEGEVPPHAAARAHAAVVATAARELGVKDPPAVPEGMALGTLVKWPEVDERRVVIPPRAARELWSSFIAASGSDISKAQLLQEANSQSRLPPLWAIVLLVIFGFDEMVGLLFNPLYLVLGVLLGAFAYQLYCDLEVDREVERGLPGWISLGRRVGPATQALAIRVLDACVHLDPEALQLHRDEDLKGEEVVPEVEMTKVPSGGGEVRRRLNAEPAVQH